MMATSVAAQARAVARRIDRSRTAEWIARTGLAARSGFYLVLAYLALRIAFLSPSDAAAANAHGALATIASSVIGKVAIVAAVVGFVGFGLARLSAAFRDPDCNRWQRAGTAIHGLFYLALTYVPLSFLVGNRSAGSERQQQERTAQLLGFPGGQVLVVGIGLVVIGVCIWQVRKAFTDDHRDDLKLRGTSAVTKKLVQILGVIGTAARAMVFLPIGGFLVVAGIRYDPRDSHGLDGELLALAGHLWGVVVIVVAAAGLLAFAAYAALEARFRDTTKPS